MAVLLEELTREENNHFTEYDILSALKTYHEADERAYRRKIEFISHKTGITLTPNKRNGRKQNVHLQIARATRDILIPDGLWRYTGGAPTAENRVREWRKSNPTGRKADCIRETGLSKKTVYKWWE